MRMQENFSGCRVLSYCLMSNHIHILLEVSPMQEGGLSDEELLKRLSAIYSEPFVSQVAMELAEARQRVAEVTAESVVVTRIHERFTYRMHDLGEFMKTFLQRFTRWFNGRNGRVGVLWESRFKSVLVEEGVAASTMAAYIDLNPVRAGITEDPAAYRWSSYGEAMGGGTQGDGKKARAGLVRALKAHKGWQADAALWPEVCEAYRKVLTERGEQKSANVVQSGSPSAIKIVRQGSKPGHTPAETQESKSPPLDPVASVNLVRFPELLERRVRYFSDGAVIGTRLFVDEVFMKCRDRFSSQRKTGARKLRDFKHRHADPAHILWSARDLQKNLPPPPGGCGMPRLATTKPSPYANRP